MIGRVVLIVLSLAALLPAGVTAQSPASWQEVSGFQHPYDLSKSRILVIAADDFNADETIGMAARWRTWGARVEFAGAAPRLTGEVEAAPGTTPTGPAPTLDVDHLLSAVQPSAYDVIYIAGGEGVGKLLDANRAELARVLGGAGKAGKVIAAICHGPIALSASPMVKGKRVTVQGQAGRDALQQAGATLVDEIAVVDGGVVTGQWPHLETFAVTVAERLQYPGGGGPYQQRLESRSPVVRAIEDQRSSHRFEAREIGPEAIEQVVRAAMKTVAAPSTRGPRAVRLVAVRDQAAKSGIATRIFESSKAFFAARGTPENVLRQQIGVLFEQAPALFFVFVDRGPATGPAAADAARTDVAYAGAMGANLLLAARSLGLGVAALGLPAFLAAEPDIKRAVAAPDSALLVNIYAMGYPLVSATPAVARPASDVLAFERWR